MESKFKSDLKYAALWALLSIPISIMGALMSWAIVHGGEILALPVLPAIIVINYLEEYKVLPQWFILGIALVAQYIAYFIFFYGFTKLFKYREKK